MARQGIVLASLCLALLAGCTKKHDIPVAPSALPSPSAQEQPSSSPEPAADEPEAPAPADEPAPDDWPQDSDTPQPPTPSRPASQPSRPTSRPAAGPSAAELAARAEQASRQAVERALNEALPTLQGCLSQGGPGAGQATLKLSVERSGYVVSSEVGGVSDEQQSCLEEALRGLKVEGVQTDSLTVQRTLNFATKTTPR